MSDLDPSRPDIPPPPPPSWPPAASSSSATPSLTPPTAPGLDSDPFRTPEHERTNVAGLIAFISALLGFCIPILPTIVAFVLGIVAMFKPRRGFAIAAIVISVIQFILMAVVAVIVVAAVRSGKFQTMGSVMIAEAELQDSLRRERRGETVFTIGEPARAFAEDAWGNSFRVEVVETDGTRQVFIWSAGPDAKFDTDDDFVAASDPKDAAENAGKRLPPLD